MKFDIIVADPPFSFKDTLEQSKVKRGAKSQYQTMNIQAIKQLKVSELAKDDAVLALWVPSSLLASGLEIMQAWGFRHTQTWIWAKTKKDPLEQLKKSLAKLNVSKGQKTFSLKDLDICCQQFDFNSILGFGMGRLFRQSHEIVLLGVKGKVYGSLKNKSQRSIAFDPNLKHSSKPETLQDRLDLMFPKAQDKLEIFARRDRAGWRCIGNQCPATIDQDVTDSIANLISQ